MTPPTGPVKVATPRGTRLTATAIVALLAWATAIGRGGQLLRDPDVFSHIAVGRWILAEGKVPAGDVFSHSMPGAPWIAHEWLVEIAIALLHDRLGWAALAVAGATCFAAALAILAYALLRYLPVAAMAVAVLAAWGLCFPHLVARPHVAVFPLLVVWTAGLVAARADNRAPSARLTLGLALVMVLWANIHGSHVFGLGLAGMFAAEALFEATDRRAAWRAVRGWGAFIVVAVAAALATPHGLSGLLFPFEVQRMSYALSWIDEWQQPDMQRGHVLEVWLMLVLLGALSLGLRLPVTRIVMVLVILHMALLHQRHAELLGLCAPLIVAPALAVELRRLGETPFARPLRDWLRAASSAGLRRGALAAAVAIAIGVGAWRLPGLVVPNTYVPAAAVEAVKRAGITGRVFNGYDVGGYLIFAGVQPFIDGRLDMYGEPLLRRFNALADMPKLLADFDIGWTLFHPADPHVAELDRLPGWRRFHADDVAVVHVRTDAPQKR
ncbi:MAG: hypothetical protein EPO55_24335 [Reyranella sp.]|uniref:hypothetical protein n=1 Tax=Reyranella sp. TaxID=1929291 RepID=UPI0011FBBB26|nr:hypothetical protein [Reyranella sp.]TAJ35604.1 MAG: hypothetical protein EPO55_24335 [Reyranella sp.]